jgi:hypothetical protein
MKQLEEMSFQSLISCVFDFSELLAWDPRGVISCYFSVIHISLGDFGEDSLIFRNHADPFLC